MEGRIANRKSGEVITDEKERPKSEVRTMQGRIANRKSGDKQRVTGHERESPKSDVLSPKQRGKQITQAHNSQITEWLAGPIAQGLHRTVARFHLLP
jgi:hypothetical protein